jgi:ABC-2 type transport system permease protein
MMRGIMLLLRMSVIVFKGLYAWLNPPAYVIIKFVVPCFQMSFFVYLAKFTLGPERLAYVAIGNAVQFVAFNTLMGVAITLASEKWFGTLPMLLITPANRLLIFASRAVVHVLDGVLGAVIGLLYAGLFFGVSFAQADLLALAGVLFLSSLTLTGLGLIIASLSLFTRTVDPIMNVAYLLVFLLAGINFPVEQLPLWLRPLSYLIPLTYGVEAARGVIAGASLGAVSGQLLIMFGLFLGEGALGYYLFTRFEGLAKRRGTLEMV